jgi:site-specific recombinase XerD
LHPLESGVLFRPADTVLGARIGNWLTVDQSKTLLSEPPTDHLRGSRDRAIIALLIGCGLRRAELVGLGTQDFEVREERWVIADLIGKGNHIRTVPGQEIAQISEANRQYMGGGKKIPGSPGDHERRLQRLQDILDELVSLTDWKKL